MSQAMKRGVALAAVVASMLCVVGLLCLSGCAPQSAAGDQDKGGKDDAAVQVAWSSDSDCTSCHAMEASSMTDASYLCATHEQQGSTCTTCHTDDGALSDVHENATDLTKTAKKLKKTEVAESVCLSCHDNGEIKAATADLALLTDDNGKTVDPHDLPTNAEHEVIECASCHAMHSAEGADEQATAKCLSCHHQNVYECHTCHS
ncbi:cytochrome c3 family protein [Raoultibacter massiliensis]|uniref:Cytochrome c3 family protein n=1 Tax=Raoultibacter massiliensis TaxID=1852371 RepID=A0ABV1J8R7_9ACTN|nr:cytochrome c3 family protein [Raoultibacter massiliensis]